MTLDMGHHLVVVGMGLLLVEVEQAGMGHQVEGMVHLVIAMDVEEEAAVVVVHPFMFTNKVKGMDRGAVMVDSVLLQHFFHLEHWPF